MGKGEERNQRDESVMEALESTCRGVKDTGSKGVCDSEGSETAGCGPAYCATESSPVGAGRSCN